MKSKHLKNKQSVIPETQDEYLMNISVNQDNSREASPLPNFDNPFATVDPRKGIERKNFKLI